MEVNKIQEVFLCLLTFHAVWLGAWFRMGFGSGTFSSAINKRTNNNNTSLSISMAPLARQSIKEETISICKGEQVIPLFSDARTTVFFQSLFRKNRAKIG